MKNLSPAEPIDPSLFFSPELVVPIDAELNKADVMTLLVKKLAEVGQIKQNQITRLSNALLSRERLATTAMGKGLAFPHLRSPLIEHCCGVIGTAPKGLDFDSLDRLPTRLIALTLSPLEARELHREILGKLCSLMSNNTLQYSLQTMRPAGELLSLLSLS